MYKILFFVVTVTGAILINLMAHGAASHPEMPNPQEQQQTPPNPLAQVQYRSIPFEQIPHLMPDSDKPGQYGFQFPKDISPQEQVFVRLTTEFQLSPNKIRCFLNPHLVTFLSFEDDVSPLHTAFSILNQGLSQLLAPLPSSADSEPLPNSNLPSSFQNDYPLAWMVVQAAETNGYLSKILDLIKSPEHTIFEHPQYDPLILTLLMAHNGLEAINKKIDHKLYIRFLNQAKENFMVLAKPANTPTGETKEKIKSTVQSMVKMGTLPSDVVQTINQYPLLKKVSDELTSLINILPLLQQPTRFALPPQEDIKDETQRIMSLLERTWAEHDYLSQASHQLVQSVETLKLHPNPIEIIQKINSINALINNFSKHLAATKKPKTAPQSEPTESTDPVAAAIPTQLSEEGSESNPSVIIDIPNETLSPSTEPNSELQSSQSTPTNDPDPVESSSPTMDKTDEQLNPQAARTQETDPTQQQP
ncbi:MAG: hypothetical protein ACK5PQ_02315 [Alphaproteobacteria bacterium]